MDAIPTRWCLEGMALHELPKGCTGTVLKSQHRLSLQQHAARHAPFTLRVVLVAHVEDVHELLRVAKSHGRNILILVKLCNHHIGTVILPSCNFLSLHKLSYSKTS